MLTDNPSVCSTLRQNAPIMRAVDRLGDRLKVVRKARGVQQNKVTGLPNGYLSKLENGHETNPTLEKFEALAAAYKFRNVGELFTALHTAFDRQINTDLQLPENTGQTLPGKTPQPQEGGVDGVDPRVSPRELQQIRAGSAALASAFARLTARLDHALRSTGASRATGPRRVEGRGRHRGKPAK